MSKDNKDTKEEPINESTVPGCTMSVTKTYSDHGKVSMSLWLDAPDGKVFCCNLQNSEHDQEGNLNVHAGRELQFQEVELVEEVVKVWRPVEELEEATDKIDDV